MQPAQGRRLGEACLRWLADEVHRRGAPALLLEVRPSNHRALRLYERVGMQRIGLRRGYYPYFDGQRVDAIVMRCALPLASGSERQEIAGHAKHGHGGSEQHAD